MHRIQPHGIRRATLATAALLALATTGAQAVEKTYRHYRFTPSKLFGGGIIQLSEFQFLDSSDIPVDVSGVIATNSTGNTADSPDLEQPGFCLDGLTSTKWLNWAVGGPTTQGIDFDFGVPTTINGYNFATANDSPDRTPVSWQLFGGVDDSPEDGIVDSWEMIDSRSDQPVDPTLYTYQLGWVIPVDVDPVIIDFNTDLGIVSNGDFAVLTWDTTLADTIDISPSPGSVEAFGNSQETPPNDSDTTYTLTASSQVSSITAEVTIRAVTPGSATFRYVRFTPTKLRLDSAANSIQLAEFDFFNLGSEVVPTSVTNPGGDNPIGGAEGPEMAIDGDIGTKWLDFNKLGLVFDFATPTTFDAYNYVTANDATERDPVQWTLEGSNDQETWTLIETVAAFDFPTQLTRGVSAQFLSIPLPDSPLPLPPIIHLFTGDAPYLVEGQPLLLTWETSETTDVTIDDGSGPVSVDLSGSKQLTPAADTSYTLSASNSGSTVTMEFGTTIISPAITSIAYADFNQSGDELSLLGNSHIFNAYPGIPEPGDVSRLRLNDDAASLNGTAWFRQRVDTSAGFDTTFGIHLVQLSGTNNGADGMSFMLQNSPTGTGSVPTGAAEDGLTTNALNIKFDSYLNAGDPSAANLQVREGSVPIATVDLTTFPGIRFPGIKLAGADTNDLSDTVGTSAPYPVRVAYTAGTPGTLDIFFQGIQVISGLTIDLTEIGAVDSSGTGYVGFAARSGTEYESHDVTNWYFTEGPPSLPELPLDIEILSSSFDFEYDEVTLTFTSRDYAAYRITATENDLSDFSAILQSGIYGETGQGQTTVIVPFDKTAKQFIRVEEEE